MGKLPLRFHRWSHADVNGRQPNSQPKRLAAKLNPWKQSWTYALKVAALGGRVNDKFHIWVHGSNAVLEREGDRAADQRVRWGSLRNLECMIVILLKDYFCYNYSFNFYYYFIYN